MTACGVNPACNPQEKLTLEGLDHLVQVAKRRSRAGVTALKLWKADIEGAFKRVPTSEADQPLLWVAVKDELQQVWVAQHKTACFGATASVHAWHRIGEVLALLARVVLRIPVLRYVDDYFPVEDELTCDHAMNAFVEMVRLLMGEAIIQHEKVMSGPPPLRF